ncbi:MAG TPA: flagellar export chaperone FliS [Marinospirillum sp.]|uniref:flagellar export chaperone FliS n=1 Tax=Marinospirillum sp. TaxID=2183934 RepID=UPI002B460D42|nr:flagellar export chaperone FliS [Marinospirillum sp.]HKM16048.1 flagellar export chaperone FliS [Marinospirillum sp.]
MSYKKSLRGVFQYAKGSDREAEVNNASPHRLIQILMESLTGYLAAGKGALERKDTPAATQALTRAQAIIIELRTCIDFEKGGEAMTTLDSVYDFMGRHLSEARAGNDAKAVQEVIAAFRPIKEAWDALGQE